MKNINLCSMDDNFQVTDNNCAPTLYNNMLNALRVRIICDF